MRALVLITGIAALAVAAESTAQWALPLAVVAFGCVLVSAWSRAR